MSKMANRITLTSFVAAAVMSIASAQGFQGGPPQGGPGGGGPGMGRGPMGGVGILMIPPVREELKLTDEQIEKLQAILPQRGGPGQGGGQRGQGGQGGQRGQGGQGGPPQRDPAEMEKLEASVKSILTKAQYKRYREISLQMSGPQAFLRKDVAKELGLTEDQTTKIQKLIEANRPQRPDGQGGPGGGEPGGPPPGGGFGGGQGGPPQGGPGGGPNDEKRKELEKKVLSILTDAQKKQWKEMQGKAFEMRRPERG